MSQAIIKKTSDYFKSKGVVLPSISELQDPQIINCLLYTSDAADE